MRAPRRFDAALMVPPRAQAAPPPGLLRPLLAWCEDAATPPQRAPLCVASIAPQAGLDGLACALDGSHQLARLGRWRGLVWRLQILWRECVAAPGAPQHGPWDCGWWRVGALAAARDFRPRRPTLLLVRDADLEQMAALLAALRAGQAAYARPVCVLLVSEAAVAGLTRL